MRNSNKEMAGTIISLSSLLLAILIPFVVLFSSVPSSPLATKGNLKEYANAIFPQFWSFFVFDPKMEQTRLYRLNLSDRNKLEYVNLSYSSKSSFNGLSRNIRATNIAFESLQKQLPDSAYTTIKGFSRITAALDTLSVTPIHNKTRVSDLKGHYVIIKSIPKIWDQRDIKNEDEVEFKIAKIYVNLNH